MADSRNVIIIGGGVVGVCAAYYLFEAGYNVTLLERRQICSGSSHGNAGLIVPGHSIPLAAPGMVAKGIKWMFDPDSPFYIKPRLDPELLSWLWKFWLNSSEGQMRKGIPLIRDLSFESLGLFDELAKLDGVDFGYHKKGMMDVFDTQDSFDAACKEAEVLINYGLTIDLLSPGEINDLLPRLDINAVGGDILKSCGW